ncbi:MAG: ABC transporter ATP-binding protein [Actinomycetota bacterium]|nr:ABC transporter ATP-binding protein [Actinomycetota bacterium]
MNGGLHADLRLRRAEFTLEARLDVPDGMTVALLGPNGAGKSTLVDALAGLLPIEEGEVVVGGDVWERPSDRVKLAPRARSIGVMFQGLLLFPALTALDNVAFGLRAQGVGRAEARSRAAEHLARFNVEEVAAQRPSELSGGQAQRVALARAIAVEPAVLLLDEPMSALDVANRTESRRTLRRALADFKGVKMIITHDPFEAMALADRLLILEEGRVTQQGSSSDMLRRPRSGYVASLAGINLLEGEVESQGRLRLSEGRGRLAIPSDAANAGDLVLASISPQAVTLSMAPPASSARNVFAGNVDAIEIFGQRARVSLETEPPLTAEVTLDAVTALGIRQGAKAWASVKATQVEVYPA